jgi:hypothetical protein
MDEHACLLELMRQQQQEGGTDGERSAAEGAEAAASTTAESFRSKENTAVLASKIKANLVDQNRLIAGFISELMCTPRKGGAGTVEHAGQIVGTIKTWVAIYPCIPRPYPCIPRPYPCIPRPAMWWEILERAIKPRKRLTVSAKSKLQMPIESGEQEEMTGSELPALKETAGPET